MARLRTLIRTIISTVLLSLKKFKENCEGYLRPIKSVKDLEENKMRQHSRRKLLICLVIAFLFIVLILAFHSSDQKASPKAAKLTGKSSDNKESPMERLVEARSRQPFAKIKENKEASIEKVRQLTGCKDKLNDFRRVRRANYWVLENYIRPDTLPPMCHETITYATHVDPTFLKYLVPVLIRWQAPVSVAVHCPGSDYDLALNSIFYLRNCVAKSDLVRNLATFHLFFDHDHIPNIVLDTIKAEQDYSCAQKPPFEISKFFLYRVARELPYPINVGRNIAQETATTYFIFVSDIELFPNPGVVGEFLKMYARLNHTYRREVFVLPVFEVLKDVNVPQDKTELQEMLKNKTAVIFHEKICVTCHKVYNHDKWVETPMQPELDIFVTGKRIGDFRYWEPFFISTIYEPLYEDMLHWDGKHDKMAQGYILCVEDYEFQVLNNAFLVHSPGIKEVKDALRLDYEKINRYLIEEQLIPQIKKLYGTRDGCSA